MAAATMHAIGHTLEGYSRAEALRNAVLAFNDRGYAGLYDRPHRRSRCRLSEAEQVSLKAMILQPPIRRSMPSSMHAATRGTW